MGELPVQTERSEVCTSYRGQDSPIQTDLAQLIRCLLYGQTRKQRNKNINNFICFPSSLLVASSAGLIFANVCSFSLPASS